LDPTAHSTARRNLAQRIDRFLREHVLTDWQADQVFLAIKMLDADDFSVGERILAAAEKASI
jgi:hypothetical protein